MNRNAFMMAAISAFMLAVCGCGRVHDDSFSWPHVNHEIDSLSRAADTLFFHRSALDSLERTVNELGRAVAELDSTDTGLRQRMDFFRAYVLKRTPGCAPASDSIVSLLYHEVDSASQPYLFNRLSWVNDLRLPVSVNKYERMVAHLEYFRQNRDRMMEANQSQSLGNMLKRMGCLAEAEPLYKFADSVFRAHGYHDMASFNSINLSSLYHRMGDTVAAMRIYDQLLADSAVKANRSIHGLVYLSFVGRMSELGMLHTSPRAYAAIDSLMQFNLAGKEGDVNLYRSMRCLHEGDALAALALADTAIRLSAGHDKYILAESLIQKAEALSELGRKGEAYDCYRRGKLMEDSLRSEENAESVAHMEVMRQVTMRKAERELDHNRRVLVWLCVAFVLFLIFSVTVWIITWRMRNLKKQRAVAANERDKMSRELIATQIAMDESRRLIDDVGREISELADGGRVSGGGTMRIASAIKSHNSRQSQRESFIETFGQVHPDFAGRLRALNPAITEPDVRLAMYVSTGVDTKQIANSMGIRPESVKQARWRLRTKLGLAKGESLERFLQGLME